MPKIIVLVGVMGIGKTSLALKLEKAGYVRLSADSIRMELYGDESVQGDQIKIYSILFSRMDEAFKAKKNIVIDNTNINKKSRVRYCKEGRANGYDVQVWQMPLDLERAIRQYNLRERQIPEEIIRKRFTSLLANLPTESEGRVVRLRK
jgi:predicted kinase